MAKVQGKKVAAKGAKSVPKKPAARVKTAAKKPAPKPVAKGKAKVAAPVRKPAKPAPRPAAKPAPKTASKPVPKPSARPAAKPKAAPKTVSKPVPPPATRPPKPAPTPARSSAAEGEKKRARRPRTRVQSNGTPVANWLKQGEKPRPSSFIPAPPRAEAPSLIAAPPASSDRLISADELTEFVVRTVPVRIDVEQNAGRISLVINPDEVMLKTGEGIEWDFRYFGGADVVVDELLIEFDRPAPFPHSTFRSRRPGTARPHRQLSGAAQKAAIGKKVRYTVRAFNGFKMELAVAKPWVSVGG